MKKCDKCGAENWAGAKFCSQCGNPLEEDKKDDATGKKIFQSIVVIAIAIIIGFTGWVGLTVAFSGAIYSLIRIWSDS